MPLDAGGGEETFFGREPFGVQGVMERVIAEPIAIKRMTVAEVVQPIHIP